MKPVLIAAASAALLVQFAYAHDDDTPGRGEKLGAVQFANSCSKEVQQALNRGVALAHSFWYTEGEKTFRDVLARDPSCTIAAWGLATVLMSNPIAGQGAVGKGAEMAQAALAGARANPPKTERERDYIEAVAAYYRDFAQTSERQRQLARAQAYERLAAKYPKDDEAQIFYALYLSATQSLDDKTYGPALKAAGILEQQFRKYPHHPGVAHYLIHSYDYPPIAAKGVDAARRYAKIAPSAPHALHMPSHIFTRVGIWDDAAETNRRSMEVARKSGDGDEAWHAMDYMVYAYLQTARDSHALKTWHDGQSVKGMSPRFVAPYAIAMIPARIAAERGDWKAAAALELRPSKIPFADAMTHFARALGAARSGNPAGAEDEVKAIGRLHGALLEQKNGYWANEVEIAGIAAIAWARLAQGNAAEAEMRMRQAADMEDKTDKHIVTPGRLVPARELLGDMLMEMKRPAEALREYEASQQREPNRLRGLYGAARAAELSGDAAKARNYYARLLTTAGKGEPRPEVAAARAFLARKNG